MCVFTFVIFAVDHRTIDVFWFLTPILLNVLIDVVHSVPLLAARQTRAIRLFAAYVAIVTMRIVCYPAVDYSQLLTTYTRHPILLKELEY